MSRLLEELKGQEATLVVGGFDEVYEIVDVDEDWVKLKKVTKKGKVTTKLVRVEDIQSVELK